jgi:uncharacterized protein
MSGVLDMRRIAPGSSHLAMEIDGAELNLDSSDIIDLVSCNAQLDVDRTSDELIVRGKVETTIKIECARCLEPFEHTMVHQLAFVIQLARKGELGGTDSESSDDFYVVSDSAEEFDISPIIRERILVSLPLKPLCDDSCRGLCPKCGVNLNVETCDCRDNEVDERWSALQDLKKQYGGN